MDYKDLFLTPVYLIMIYAIAYWIRSKFTNKLTKKYFIPALTFKLIGAISLGLIYKFYYKGGDTYNYFRQSKIVFNALVENTPIGIRLLFSSGDLTGPIYEYASRIYWFKATSEFFIVKLTAFLGLFCFQTYSVIALFFAIISFSGLWAMYKTFLKIYPNLYKEFAYAIFFIPSVFFWGSGLMKDTICIGALGWLFYSFYNIFIEKNKILFSLIILAISIFVIKTIKVYILLSFLPPAIFWVFIENSTRIKNPIVRYSLAPLFIFLGVMTAYYGATNITKGDEIYALEKIGERTKVNAEYLYQISQRDQGSAYHLGELDGSVGSMVKLAPQAIFVSLFRPFIWEVRNPVMLLSAIEATIFIFLTLRLILITGVIKTLQKISTTPILIFCFIFSIVFAFGVGINSYNFGSLVRYKIPLLPFYVCGLFILEFYQNKNKTKKLQLS